MSEDEILVGLQIARKDLLDVRLKKGFGFIQFKDSQLMNKYKRQISTIELKKRKVLVYKVKDGKDGSDQKKGGAMKERTGFRGTGNNNRQIPLKLDVQETNKEVQEDNVKVEKRNNKDFRSMYNL